jgi:hypothetical protein
MAKRCQFEAATWFISRSLLVDREETYRCLAIHPYYQRMEQIQHEIKQELIWFFNRRFTYQMGELYGINLCLDDILLRLGPDSAFRENGLLDCGGSDEITVKEDNKKAWAFLITFNRGGEEASIEKCGISRQIPPIFDKHTRDSDNILAKRSERVANSEVEKGVAKLAVAPETCIELADRVTASEIMKYEILTKQTLGPGALEAQTAVIEDHEPTDEALSDISEDEAGGVSCRLIQRKDGSWDRTSMVDGELMDAAVMEDVSLD